MFVTLPAFFLSFRSIAAPTLEEVARIGCALNEVQARYVLIGGFAVIVHGSGRTSGLTSGGGNSIPRLATHRGKLDYGGFRHERNHTIPQSR